MSIYNIPKRVVSNKKNIHLKRRRRIFSQALLFEVDFGSAEPCKERLSETPAHFVHLELCAHFPEKNKNKLLEAVDFYCFIRGMLP